MERKDIRVVAWYKAPKRWLEGNQSLEGSTNANVDGFQGSECEVVVLSTVRCNGRGEIGLVKDRKRMNVALTRAKRGVIVVGNYHILIGGDDEGL